MSNINVPALSSSDIVQLVCRYARTNVPQMGQEGLLEHVLGQDDFFVAVIDWQLSDLVMDIFCVIGAESSHQPWVMRMVLTPDFLWISLYAVQPDCPRKLIPFFLFYLFNVTSILT